MMPSREKNRFADSRCLIASIGVYCLSMMEVPCLSGDTQDPAFQWCNGLNLRRLIYNYTLYVIGKQLQTQKTMKTVYHCNCLRKFLTSPSQVVCKHLIITNRISYRHSWEWQLPSQLLISLTSWYSSLIVGTGITYIYTVATTSALLC